MEIRVCDHPLWVVSKVIVPLFYYYFSAPFCSRDSDSNGEHSITNDEGGKATEEGGVMAMTSRDRYIPCIFIYFHFLFLIFRQ